MWVILLDRSQSMDDPFSGGAEEGLPGRIRQGEWGAKWDAARDAVVKAVRRLGGEQIGLIVFNEAAKLVYDERPIGLERLKDVLEGLGPEGGTDLAAALRAAQGYVESRSGEGTANVVIITDGLSSLEPARDAARDLATRAAVIDVILIDPTPNGRAVAQAIIEVAVEGEVTFVVSAPELDKGVDEAAARQAEESQRVESVLARAGQDRRETVAATPTDERLSFTASYPGRPFPDVWYPLTIYLHLSREDVDREVRRRAFEKARAVGQPFASSTDTVWAQRGTWLTLTPRVEGLEFNPPSQEIVWYEDIQDVPFRFRCHAGHAGKVLAGLVDVAAREVTVGALPLAVTVRAEGETPPAEGDADDPDCTTGRMYEAVFASYAHLDREVVELCAATYKALGIHMYIDRESLTVGRPWHPGLLRLIDDADVFQLYWSEAASASPYVKDEWEYALGRRSLKGDRFVRGLYWKEPLTPQPPDQLASLHFGFLDREALEPKRPDPGPAVPDPPHEGSGEVANEDGTEPTIEAIRTRAAAVQAAVVPLLPGESRRSLAALRESAALAVAFLEGITGLRYYPVPTLLLDEFTVRQVRSILEVVETVPRGPGADQADLQQAKNELAIWRDVAQCLLLEFHSRHVPPFARTRPAHDTDDEHVEPRDNLRDGIAGLTGAAVGGLREFAEWGVKAWLWDYLFDPWVPHRVEPGPDGWPPAPDERNPLSRIVMGELDGLVDALRRAVVDGGRDVSKRKLHLSSSWNLSAFDDRRAWDAICDDGGLRELRATKRDITWSGGSCDFRPEHDWGYEIEGTRSELFRALQACRDRLAELLPELDHLNPADAGGPDARSWRAIGFAVVAGKLGAELRDGLASADGKRFHQFAQWAVDQLYPSWRRARDFLKTWGVDSMSPDLDFPAFLAEYLRVMASLFEFGSISDDGFTYEGRYGIRQQVSHEIVQRDGDLNLSPRQHDWGTPDRITLHGPFTDFVLLFRRGSRRLLEALEKVPPRMGALREPSQQVQDVFEAATFGIFAAADSAGTDDRLAEWSVRNHVATQLTLPGSARVLFCTRAIAGAEIDSRTLGLCTLIHEHFHAVLEHGVAPDGSIPCGPSNRVAWTVSNPLNESLAVWMECHYVERYLGSRGSVEATAAARNALWEYVRSGPYPQWPYRGAERVEAIYQRRGIAGVRELIYRLRTDPCGAQEEFEYIDPWTEL